jgi:hypothetical protein
MKNGPDGPFFITARGRRSAEAEHQVILGESLLSSQPRKRSFKEVLASMPYFGDDDLFDVR